MKIPYLIPLILCLTFSFGVQAETRIHERDRFGNRTGKSYVLKNGKEIYETSRSGKIRHDKPSWVIEGDTVYERNRFGSKTGKNWKVE